MGWGNPWGDEIDSSRMEELDRQLSIEGWGGRSDRGGKHNYPAVRAPRGSVKRVLLEERAAQMRKLNAANIRKKELALASPRGPNGLRFAGRDGAGANQDATPQTTTQ